MTTPADPLLADARRVLGAWEAPSDRQADLRARFLAFLDLHPDAASRDQRAGHLTASTVLLDHERECVLLTLHPVAGRWFHSAVTSRRATRVSRRRPPGRPPRSPGSPGWRCSPGRSGWTGTRCAAPTAPGGAGPAATWTWSTWRYAPAGARARRSAESLDLAWFDLDALPPGTDEVVRGLVRRVRELGLA